MQLHANNLRLIFGLKLKSLRAQREHSLKELSARSGLSVSYLSEIEKGKKYPKPEKLFALATALGVSFDELVSTQVSEELSPLTDLFNSTYLREFPFELFGVEAGDVVSLIGDDPAKATAFLNTFVEIGRTYDVEVEHFLLAALRSYQQLHLNHFPELEDAATAFRQEEDLPREPTISPEALVGILERRWRYRVDFEALQADGDMRGFRSVFVDDGGPRLYVNGRLLPEQQAFVLAREIGYCTLGLEERAHTSSWVKVESFDQILNNFRASYFAGALLLDRAWVVDRLGRLFAQQRWSDQAFIDCLHDARSTPEMFFHRLSEVIPTALGFKEIYFIRFSQSGAPPSYRLTKLFNTSKIPLPHGAGFREHYCRRWSALRILKRLDQEELREPHTAGEPILKARRSFFLEQGQEFLVISMARPLAIDHDVHSSVTIGLRLDDALRDVVGFWNDPALHREEVNITCERCPLSKEECVDRVAAPVYILQRQAQERQEGALARFLAARHEQAVPR